MKSMFERLFFGTYKCLATLERHANSVNYFALYGNKLFSGSYEKIICVWC